MSKDAIALLEADHERVEALFREFKTGGSTPETKMDLAQTICAELTLHAMVEEEIFYPAYAQATGDEEMVKHAVEEHQEVKDLIAKVPQADNLEGAIAALMQHVTHHVEDERSGMFKKARDCGMELVTVGRRIETRRAEVMDAIQAS
jgi:hemerythrin superfamily protein